MTILFDQVADVLSGGSRWAVLDCDAADLFALLPDQSVHHLICDPAYSRRVHENARTSRRNKLPDVDDHDCRKKRRVEISFEYLKPATRRLVAREAARTVKRWSLVFADVEGSAWWRISMMAAGINYLRTGEWDRLGAAPQFNGTEPAAASEMIVIGHRPGRRRWNGGGRVARWSCPIVANRKGQEGSRIHETQKPEPLLIALVIDFTDDDEIVVDPFCGSGTTGVACLRMGRRFIGCDNGTKKETGERWAAIAAARMRAHEGHRDYALERQGQRGLFGT